MDNLLYEKVKGLLSEFIDEEKNEINIVDSFQFVQLILLLEEEFEIEFDDELIFTENISNINNLVSLIETKINSRWINQ